MKNEIFEVTLVCDITTAQETLRKRYADANAISSVRILLGLSHTGHGVGVSVAVF